MATIYKSDIAWPVGALPTVAKADTKLADIIASAEIECRFLGLSDYCAVRNLQEQYVLRRQQKEIGDSLIFCEHFPVITFGKNCPSNITDPCELNLPRVATDRGGLITYHGPGQILIYPVVDLGALGLGVRQFIELGLNAMAFVFRTLCSESKEGIKVSVDLVHPGVWAEHRGQLYKVGFVGLRIQKGITNHGFSLNLANDCSIFSRFVPCGMEGLKVSSLTELGCGMLLSVEEVATLIGREFCGLLKGALGTKGVSI